MHIAEAEDRIWSRHKEYYNALLATGYGETVEAKPHIEISQILKKLKPHQLYHRMLDIVKWQKNTHREKNQLNN